MSDIPKNPALYPNAATVWQDAQPLPAAHHMAAWSDDIRTAPEGLKAAGQDVTGWHTYRLTGATGQTTGLCFVNPDRPAARPITTGTGAWVPRPLAGPAGDLWATLEPEAAAAIAAVNMTAAWIPDPYSVDKTIQEWQQAGHSVRLLVRLTELASLKQGQNAALGLIDPPAWGDCLEQVQGLIGLAMMQQRDAAPTPAPWPDPRPLQTRLHPVQALNRAMLPTDLCNYIYDQAERIPMVPDMVAVSVLVALGSVLGARVAIKPKRMDDFAVVTNIWGGFIAPPSSNKSAAFTAGLKPIDKLVAEAITAHQAALAEHQASQIKAQASAKALKSRLDKAAKAGDSEGMDAIIAAMQEDDSDTVPALRRYKTNDSSPEALAELEASNPNGILVCRDELTGLLANLDKEGNGEARAFYLESWNGTAPYEVDRILRGHSYIENHCLTVLGGIQPDKLIAYLTPAIRGLGNDGLIQRFQLLVYPDPINWCYVDRAPDQTARNVVYDLFARIDRLHEGDLIRLGAHPSDDYNKRPFFRFSDAAQAHYVDWLTRLHTQKLAHEPQPILCEHLSKYQKLMPALALLFHIVETINDDRGGPVSLRAAEMAADWCDYLESHARRIYGLVLDQAQIAAATLAQKILHMGQKGHDKTDSTHDWLKDGFTASMVARKNWKGLTDIETIHAAIDVLADHQWLRIVQGASGERGGRPSQTARINPKIFTMLRNGHDKTDSTPIQGVKSV